MRLDARCESRSATQRINRGSFMFCRSCGKPIDEADAFCRSCGKASTSAVPSVSATRVPLRAWIVICIFLIFVTGMFLLGWHNYLISESGPAVKAEEVRDDFAHEMENTTGTGGFDFDVEAVGAQKQTLLISSGTMSDELAALTDYRGEPLDSLSNCTFFQTKGFLKVQAKNTFNNQLWDLCGHWRTPKPQRTVR